MNLNSPIANEGKIFKLYAKRLEKLDIVTFKDFLYHIPSRYEDYSLISNISNIQPGEIVTIKGTIIDIKNTYTRKFTTIQKAKVEDKTGIIEITWFNQPFLTRVIHKDDQIALSGKTEQFLNKIVLQSPDYEIITENAEQIHTGRLVPIYPETKGVSSKWLRRQIYKILQEQKQNILEYLPDSIIDNNRFMQVTNALEEIHFPTTLDNAQKAKERLAFDELFLLNLNALQKRSDWEENLLGHIFSISKFKRQIEEFWKKLPFELTDAQKRAVEDIFADLSKSKPMNRLLEGDVGSGKTVVSAIAMYLTFLNGFQSVLMAPTEILAQQHFKTISSLLNPFDVQVNLATGSQKLKIENLKLKILIGTHAVLSKNINFDKLGLVVIDEQQRFGVEQRALIRQKGKNPHVLTMTATPIPRTIALTLYGNLDLSMLSEMPIGRKTIKTWLVPAEKRENAYKWIEKQLKETGGQAFIICPFIEESETFVTVKAAAVEFERLKKEVFPNLKLGLLHGKLGSKDKYKVLDNFRNKKFDILVATPVVEVGIDIPNAVVMVIEASDRFGLSQLHQLRGRVGRGDKQSYCLLFTDAETEQVLYRLKAMESMNVGAELAEFDLKLRGPGNLYGTLQHGRSTFKIARFSDYALLEKAKNEAQKIFPKVDSYPLLTEKLKEISTKDISPD